LRANQVRLADAFREHEPAEARRALLEAESTRNYDLGIGTLSLATFIPLVRAQLLTAQGWYSDAVPLYSGTLDKVRRENLKRREACFYADRAWCHLQLGHIEAALVDAEIACQRAQDPADADDLASTHARVAEILARTGQLERSSVHRDLSLEFRRQHTAAQAELLGGLQQAFPIPARLSS
jgi:tetratricopeptide (TPR) repeat protein